MVSKRLASKAKDQFNIQKNEKGQLMSLLAASKDGIDLKNYVENGAIDASMTPAQVKEKFPQFKCYDYNCLSGSLRRVKKSLNKQIKDRKNYKHGCKFLFYLFIYIFMCKNIFEHLFINLNHTINITI